MKYGKCLILGVLVNGILFSCNNSETKSRNTDYKNLKSYTVYDDSCNIEFVVTQNISDSLNTTIEGPYCTFHSNKKLSTLGYKTTKKVLIRNEIVDYAVKADKWYYFGVDGGLDSIIDYKNVIGSHWNVKITDFEDRQYIDSLFTIDYEKDIVFRAE